MTRLLLAALVAGLLAAGPALAQNSQGGGTASSQDRTFVQQAAQGNVAETEEGQLAMRQAASPAVREFGRWMFTDHTGMAKWLAMIAVREGVQVPATPDQEQTQRLSQLQGLRGEQFDRTYIPDQVRDHQKTIALFQQEAQSGQNPRLKFFAQQSIPVLQQHLAEAQELQSLAASGSLASSGAR
jgi:putative membrane protein